MKHKLLLLLILLVCLNTAGWVYCNYPDDGGWYLMAAEKGGEGWIPYKDFFFPQGPLMIYMYVLPGRSSNPVLYGRLLSALYTLFSIFILLTLLKRKSPNRFSRMVFLSGILLYPMGLSYLTMVKTHAPVLLLFSIAIWAQDQGKNWLSLCMLLGVSILRISTVPLYVLFVLWHFRKQASRVLVAVLILALTWGMIYLLSEGKVFEQLFVPMKLINLNAVSRYFNQMKGSLSTSEILSRKASLIYRALLSFPFLILLLFQPKPVRHSSWVLYFSLVFCLIHFLPDRPYAEYLVPGFVLLLYWGCLNLPEQLSWNRTIPVVILFLISILLPYGRVLQLASRQNYMPYLHQLQNQRNFIRKQSVTGNWYILDCYIGIHSGHSLLPESSLGKFSYLNDAPNDFVKEIGIFNNNLLKQSIHSGSLDAIYLNDPSMGKGAIPKLLKDHSGWKQIPLPVECFRPETQLWHRRTERN